MSFIIKPLNKEEFRAKLAEATRELDAEFARMCELEATLAQLSRRAASDSRLDELVAELTTQLSSAAYEQVVPEVGTTVSSEDINQIDLIYMPPTTDRPKQIRRVTRRKLTAAEMKQIERTLVPATTKPEPDSKPFERVKGKHRPHRPRVVITVKDGHRLLESVTTQEFVVLKNGSPKILVSSSYKGAHDRKQAMYKALKAFDEITTAHVKINH